MKDQSITVLFRWPSLPVIIIHSQAISVARDRKQLTRILAGLPQSPVKWDVKLVDPTFWEFWFDTRDRVLAPGFAVKKWTKRGLIDLYNKYRGPDLARYEPRSLQNYRFDRIVNDIAQLLASRLDIEPNHLESPRSEH